MRKYGCGSFLFDCILVIMTGGLWLIWILVRAIRRRKYKFIWRKKWKITEEDFCSVCGSPENNMYIYDGEKDIPPHCEECFEEYMEYMDGNDNYYDTDFEPDCNSWCGGYPDSCGGCNLNDENR